VISTEVSGQLYLNSQDWMFLALPPSLAALAYSNSGDSTLTSFLVRNLGMMWNWVGFMVPVARVQMRRAGSTGRSRFSPAWTACRRRHLRTGPLRQTSCRSRRMDGHRRKRQSRLQLQHRRQQQQGQYPSPR